MVAASLFNLQRFSLHDGPGIRTTVFLQGCPLECAWCHNPESRPADPEQSPLADRCRGVEVADLLVELERDRVFYEESGGGVTFSGGEPLGEGPNAEFTLSALALGQLIPGLSASFAQSPIEQEKQCCDDKIA